MLVFGLVALFVVIMGVLWLSILATAYWEKQRVRDFAPAKPDELPPPSPYFKAMNQAARELGFQFGGLFGQNRNSSMYRCCLGLWISSDGTSLLCIAGGKMARVNYKKTMFISQLDGEQSLVTMDSFGSEDLSGTRQVDVLMNADLSELYQFHRQRLASQADLRPFSTNDLLSELEKWNRLRAQRLVAKGLARYISADENAFRFTAKGAWECAVAAHSRSLQKATAQKERMKKKRPGS